MTLFYKRTNGHILIVQIYVDDIVFGSSCSTLLKDFVESTSSTFEIEWLETFISSQVFKLNKQIVAFLFHKKKSML